MLTLADFLHHIAVPILDSELTHVHVYPLRLL